MTEVRRTSTVDLNQKNSQKPGKYGEAIHRLDAHTEFVYWCRASQNCRTRSSTGMGQFSVKMQISTKVVLSIPASEQQIR